MAEHIDPLAGQPAPRSVLVNVPRLVAAYFALTPDPAIAAQRVVFGTSGHRGSAFAASFNEAHVLAITQAVCTYRRHAGIEGPLFLGIDTHALSEPAFVSAIEVLAANDVNTMIDAAGGYTPTPVISHAILRHNRGRTRGRADGIVISPSHNPPDQGGFKYNPPNGGPADVDVTGFIEKEANRLLADGLKGLARMPYARARASAYCHSHDYVTPYVEELGAVVDLEAIRAAGVRIGIDPLGGAAVSYWEPVIARYGIAAHVVNTVVDPAFAFMTLDWDGQIRMDCSSHFAMTGLIALRDSFDVAFANDTDADRHGIVCPSAGLMRPNDFLATSIAYLCTHRPHWNDAGGIGKTVVSSGMIDRIAAKLGRRLYEVPVGFKWFSQGLQDGSLAFGGEESAGASFVRHDGSVWTTDKDGLIMGLLAAEMTATTGKDPGQLYLQATAGLGTSYYARTDAPATRAQKMLLSRQEPAEVEETELAGEKIIAKQNRAPGNDAAIGGLKVTTSNGWFAARPSGTEAVYKIYAESFQSADHLRQIQDDAQAMVNRLFAKAAPE